MSVDDLRGWVRALTEPVDRDAVRVVFHTVGAESFERTVSDAVDGEQDPANRAMKLAAALESLGGDLRFEEPPHWLRIAHVIIDIGWELDPVAEGLASTLPLAPPLLERRSGA